MKPVGLEGGVMVGVVSLAEEVRRRCGHIPFAPPQQSGVEGPGLSRCSVNIVQEAMGDQGLNQSALMQG